MYTVFGYHRTFYIALYDVNGDVITIAWFYQRLTTAHAPMLLDVETKIIYYHF